MTVMANTPASLINTPEWTGDVAIDSQDNLFIGSCLGAAQGVYVLPKARGMIYGQAVVADTLKQLVTTSARVVILRYPAAGRPTPARGS